jgi:hypothetical protein
MLTLWRDVDGGVGVTQLTHSNEIADLVELFAAIAHEQGWQPAGALQRHLSRSVYFGLQEALPSATLVGGLQLVLPGPGGHLPCYEVWPEAGPPQSTGSTRLAHIAMLGILEEHRGDSLAFWRLAVEMWRYCVEQRLSTLLIEVTPRVLPLYRRLGWPLQILEQPRMHWGEECYLCTLEIAEVAQVLLQRMPTSVQYGAIVGQAFRVPALERARPTTETPLTETSPLELVAA